jgi:hypothetical protein
VVQYIAKYGLYDDDPDPVADPVGTADGTEAENEAARYSRSAPVNEHASTE